MSVEAAPQQNLRARELQRVAAELFFAKGYKATTIREIADALAIKSASIYYHWENKEAILFDLVRSTMEQLIAGARCALDREERPARRLAALAINHVVVHALRPKEAILGETELRSLTGERLEHALGMRDEYEGLVLGVLEQGRASGDFDLLDLKLTGYAVISQCTNVGIWYREDGRLGLEDVGGVYARLALRAVGAAAVDASGIGHLATGAREFHEGWR
jgi:TetR/AcrR family transcriptional regulator, cholesterol catabolism regulator